jgi:transposase-like protein
MALIGQEVFGMTKEVQREIQRKLRVLQHAERTGQVSKTCRYFGIGRASFYRWKRAYERDGEDGLANAEPIPKSSPNQTPVEVEEKVLHLRRKYHLGPERIMWYMARYHAVRMSDATIYRILKRHGLNRLPRGTRLRKIHTKRYNKQAPGHHIQMDVKFWTFIGKNGQKVRRFRYTAIDDATRVRALKVYKRHTQANAIDFVNHIIDNFSLETCWPVMAALMKPAGAPRPCLHQGKPALQRTASQCAMAMSSRPSSIGMLRISASATPT